MDSLHAKIIELMKGATGSVLDAGAGEGRLSKALAGMGLEVTACDISTKEFRYGRCDRIDLNGRLPYKNSSFDHMICAEVVEHMENPHHLLRESARVLKKGGTLIITTPNIANLFSRIKFLLTGKFFCFSDNERKLGHLNPVAWWEMEDALEMHGFRVERINSNNHFMLSGCSNARGTMLRLSVRLLYIILYPFVRPKNKELLKGDSLIFVARKVK